MSLQIMGALISRGPRDRTQFCVLNALANYSDPFGFAFPSIETIAFDARCDLRTTRRQIMQLEADEWIHCARRVVEPKNKESGGYSNAYILNLAKIGVTAPPGYKPNPLFSRICKDLQVTMTPIFTPKTPSEDLEVTDALLEDNPQPPTGQNDRPTGQNDPTYRAKSPTYRAPHPPNRINRINRTNRLEEPVSDLKPAPLPPTGGAEDPVSATQPEEPDQALWATFIAELRRQFYDVPIGVESAKHWKQIQPGDDDFRACFSAWWLRELERGPAAVVFRTYAHNEPVTEAGIVKYRKRLTQLARMVFSLGEFEPVNFAVLQPDGPSVPVGDRSLAIAAVDAGSEADLSPTGTDGENHGPNGEIPEGDLEAWEEVRRVAIEHLERLSKTNPAIKREWVDTALVPARLVAVELTKGKRLWHVRSPDPATTMVALDLDGAWRDTGVTKIVVEPDPSAGRAG